MERIYVVIEGWHETHQDCRDPLRLFIGDVAKVEEATAPTQEDRETENSMHNKKR